jgi:hypothetical protein
MKTALKFSLTLITATMASALTALADAPSGTNGVLVPEFIVAADGTLDSPDDLLFDVDPYDPAQPDLLSQVLKPNGQPLTFGEFSQARGMASVKFTPMGSHVVIKASGLIPHGVYTVWLMTFAAPGFTPNYENLTSELPLGPSDGSRNSFTASAAGEAVLSTFHASRLFDEFEFHFAVVYHPDGKTYGPTPGPADALNQYSYIVDHHLFKF